MATEILAPMPGTIINILVKEGDEVLEYQEVVILEAMKIFCAFVMKKFSWANFSNQRG
jgi:biotin carboxyl carrier protein